MNSLANLSIAQVVAVYNHHADKPVARFENRQIAARRLAALLAKIEVEPADALAAVFPAKADQETQAMIDQVAVSNAKHDAYQTAKAEPVPSVVKLKRAQAAVAKVPAYDQGPAPATVAAQYAADALAEAAVETTKQPGRARAAIIATASRPEGATAVELYAATGWKHCSWNHHLKVAAKQSGRIAEVRRANGTTRYFLLAR